MTVPLGPPDAPTGAMVALRRRNAFLHDEIDLAQLVAERVAVAIERARLYEREHTVSTALQRSLLPGDLPEVRGTRTAVRYKPAGGASRPAATGTTPSSSPLARWPSRSATSSAAASPRRR